MEIQGRAARPLSALKSLHHHRLWEHGQAVPAALLAGSAVPALQARYSSQAPRREEQMATEAQSVGV